MRHTAVILIAASALPASGGAQDIASPPTKEVAALFAAFDVLELRLEAPLTSVLRDRGERKPREATLSYEDSLAGPVTLPVTVRMYGNFRADPDNCDFPPLRMDLDSTQAASTVFAGLDKLRLVSHCRDGEPEYEQYVLREYLAYRIYNLLTDVSVRARLVRMTYMDTERRRATLTRYAFFVEDYNDTAARNGWHVLPVKNVVPAQYDQGQLSLFEVFQYLIANTDWAVVRGEPDAEWCCHNAVPVGTWAGPVMPLPFDFDWSGIVNARYASPSPRLRIPSVRVRRFWGLCRPQEELEAVFPPFQYHREAIYDLYRDLPGLDQRYLRETLEYLDEFYEVIGDPEAVHEEMTRRCRG
jgi:hypothetical protein